MGSPLTEQQRKELERTVTERRAQYDTEVKKDIATFREIIESKVQQERAPAKAK